MQLSGFSDNAFSSLQMSACLRRKVDQVPIRIARARSRSAGVSTPSRHSVNARNIKAHAGIERAQLLQPVEFFPRARRQADKRPQVRCGGTHRFRCGEDAAPDDSSGNNFC